MLVAGVMSLGGVRAAAQPVELTIGRWEQDVLLVRIHERVVNEACRRAGVSVRYEPLPLARSIQAANDGEIDGDLYRIADAAIRYPNLIRVPTPTGRVDVAVYGGTAQIRDMTRAQIARLRIGATRGVLVVEKQASGLPLTLGRSPEAIRLMLVGGHVDALIAAYIDTEKLRLGGTLPGLYLWPHRWGSEPLFLMLHKRHAAVADRLDEALQEMKHEGLIERIYTDETRLAGVADLPD